MIRLLQHSRLSFRLYLGLIIGAGAGVLLAALSRLAQDVRAVEHGWALVLFAVLMLAFEIWPVWVADDADYAIVASLAFCAAITFLAPGLIAPLLVAAVSALADASRRAGWMKTAFNAAVTALMSAAAIGVLTMGGVARPPVDAMAVNAAVATVALLMMWVTTNGLTSIVMSLHTGQPLVGNLRRTFSVSAATDGVLLPLGPVMVLLVEDQPFLLPLVLVLAGVVFGTSRFAANRHRDARRDALTGLANRRMIDERAELMLTTAIRNQRPLAVLLLDLDDFKPINDGFGHGVGDEVLVTIADRLRNVTTADMLLGRLGGDEFVIIAEVTGSREAMGLAERLGAEIARPMTVSLAHLTTSASIGVAVFPESGATVAELTRAADAAMYTAKRQLAPVIFADDAISERTSPLLIDLERAIALDVGDMRLHFQPILDVRTGGVVGSEALLRWTHETLGEISPSHVIPQAERTTVIHQLTAWALESALRTTRMLHDAGHDLWTSVNVSPRDLADPEFATRVIRALDRHDLEGRWLTLELTETAEVADIDAAATTCHKLRRHGVKIAIDDFGSIGRGITELRDLPISTIKLDRSMMTDVEPGGRGLDLLRGLMTLAQQVGASTVAEGIDTLARRTAAEELQCDLMQGYALARPMGSTELLAWMDGRASIAIDGASPRLTAPAEIRLETSIDGEDGR